MTTKLYYQDAEISSVQVKVLQSKQDANGFYLVMDQTCFYPEGGGQPADTGKIGEAHVVDVKTVDGEIRHYTDIELPVGSYFAELDWQKRRDHMQQHAGQHLLSALLEDTFGLKTQSFHLGKERVSIDLDLDTATSTQLLQVEEKANALIAQGLSISSKWVSSEKAQAMKLRKPPVVEGDVRLVEIDGIDLNACGGTHPKNTGEIGLIKIISTEKNKGGMRLYFLCGNRALRHFNFLLETTDQLVVQLNAPVAELTQAAQTLLTDKATASKKIKELHEQIIALEAQTMLPTNGVITQVFDNRPVKDLQQLARLITRQHPSITALLLSQSQDEMRFVCAQGEQALGDMNKLLQQLLSLTEGKGGGTKKLAQGGGKTTESATTFIEVFHEALKKLD